MRYVHHLTSQKLCRNHNFPIAASNVEVYSRVESARCCAFGAAAAVAVEAPTLAVNDAISRAQELVVARRAALCVDRDLLVGY